MTKLEHSQQLRACTERKYNCSQAVLVPFATEKGLDPETAYLLAAPFQGGMKMGATCGAITGGLMALGLLGAGEDKWKQLLAHYNEKYGSTNCADLIKIGLQKGNRKQHCDSMVFEAVQLVEELMQQ